MSKRIQPNISSGFVYLTLSHDVFERVYKFTDKRAGRLRTTTILMRGYPAAVFCSTETKPVEELASRGFTHTPERSDDKRLEANTLQGIQDAYPWMFDEKEDKTLTKLREVVKHIRERRLKETQVYVPFGEQLGKAFPH